MILELADRSIPLPPALAEDVFVKVEPSTFQRFEELKNCEAKTDETSNDEPSKVELKDLPPHLEYAFLEGDNKLPVIIAKDLSVGEKAALIKVLQSHKRAIAWKLSDIKDKSLDHSALKYPLCKEDSKSRLLYLPLFLPPQEFELLISLTTKGAENLAG
ncbi:hypothetical protein Tco_0099345 [Tanacetum coccineum]